MTSYNTFRALVSTLLKILAFDMSKSYFIYYNTLSYNSHCITSPFFFNFFFFFFSFSFLFLSFLSLSLCHTPPQQPHPYKNVSKPLELNQLLLSHSPASLFGFASMGNGRSMSEWGPNQQRRQPEQVCFVNFFAFSYMGIWLWWLFFV